MQIGIFKKDQIIKKKDEKNSLFIERVDQPYREERPSKRVDILGHLEILKERKGTAENLSACTVFDELSESGSIFKGYNLKI
ncbi:hypothetical protein BpHYR1_047953 [Brachionus plicatilis]|uniref:Uncharacterized protein n=1 Tax=Brachionus plicatilis TaxID=10195 RepID=A0A3M7S0U0_BRAPC|nr:hypothetical protein BpHYR1_047953 [Brachionus plicatilis]